MTEIYTVEGVTAYIRELFERDIPLQDLWIRGEISNMKRAASGHWYFTLKDKGAQIRCVMFRTSAERQTIRPGDGDAVQVHGRISVYEQRGEYQLYADQIQLAGGIGDLYRRFEETKAKLEAEGLFDISLKRPLPDFPLRIGVVTSPDAAAFQDVKNVLARRFPLAGIILSPTLVQGADAPPLIIQAIQRLNSTQTVDVIIVCRGGGSIEDLWAFNDEAVARAIRASRIPIVSGVGHETDFTIADFVADHRAPTPSSAAEVSTPDVEDLRLELANLQDALRLQIERSLSAKHNKLDLFQKMLGYASPERAIGQHRIRTDELSGRMETSHKRYRNTLKERLAERAKALQNANPEALLARGYAIVTRSDNQKLITGPQDAPPGTGVSIQTRQGELKARIEDDDSHGRYKRTLF